MGQSPSWEAVTHLVKKFPTLYGTRRFTTVFTKSANDPNLEQKTSSPRFPTLSQKK